jgi:hypothetical protein
MNIVLSYRSGKSHELDDTPGLVNRFVNDIVTRTIIRSGSIRRASNILEGVAATVAGGRCVNPVLSAIGDSLNKKCNAP